MGSCLRDGALTVWAKGTQERTVCRGCRVEVRQGQRVSDVGPQRSRQMRAFAFGPCAAAPGDRCMPGDWDCERPPDGAFLVESVEGFSLGGAPHHVEVVAR